MSAATPGRSRGRPAGRRLGGGAQFQAVFQRGKRVERRSFLLLWVPSPAGQQAGFAVSRQVRGAVERNRCRRRLREAYRLSRPTEAAPAGIVVVGRPEALRVPFPDLCAEMGGALRVVAEAAGRGGGERRTG